MSYALYPADASYVHACASVRFRERCIVPIDVPCMWHLYVHVWVRHTDLAYMSAGLRPLLKKGNAWVWEKEHEEEFNNIKNLLTDRDEQGNEVILKDTQKIVVPRGAQDEILKELQRSHSGILKAYTTAAQLLYYWPGMKNSIKKRIESCGSCQRDRPSKQRTTIHIYPPSKAQSPMKHVAVDLFDAAGEKWIVLVDR